MSKHTSTKKGRDFRRVVTEQYESRLRLAETLKLRGLSANTRLPPLRG
jgi:hypothetical protein